MATSKAVLDLGNKLVAKLRESGPKTIAQLAAETHISSERVRHALRAMADREQVTKTMVDGRQRWLAASGAAARVDVAPPNGATSALGTRRLAPRDEEIDLEEPASLFV